jgi:hypothetical protein
MSFGRWKKFPSRIFNQIRQEMMFIVKIDNDAMK